MSKDPKGIMVGKKFTITHDGNSWVVVTHPTNGSRTRTDKQGNVALVGSYQYFGDIMHALRAIYNSRLKGVKSIEELKEMTERHHEELLAVGKEIRDALDQVHKRVLDME